MKHIIFDFDGVIGDTYEATVIAHIIADKMDRETVEDIFLNTLTVIQKD